MRESLGKNIFLLHTTPDESSSGGKFVRLGIAFARNHVNLTKIVDV